MDVLYQRIQQFDCFGLAQILVYFLFSIGSGDLYLIGYVFGDVPAPESFTQTRSYLVMNLSNSGLGMRLSEFVYKAFSSPYRSG